MAATDKERLQLTTMKQRNSARHLGILALCGLCALSCVQSKWDAERERVIEASRQVAMENQWPDVHFDSVTFTNGYWEVYMWQVPAIAGGDAILQITPSGKVLSVSYGH